VAVALAGLGQVHSDLGDSQNAIQFYEQALVTARKLNHKVGEATWSWNLGLVYEALGEYHRAAELIEVTLKYNRSIGHPDAVEDARRLEEIYAKLGLHEGKG
jgi:tetratricopeptide (TPR) repeat protein